LLRGASRGMGLPRLKAFSSLVKPQFTYPAYPAVFHKHPPICYGFQLLERLKVEVPDSVRWLSQ
jgi:hypothetical protein